MERTNAAVRDGHAADAGVIVGQRAQGGPDELDEVRMVWKEEVLPERRKRFSARGDMQKPPAWCDGLAKTRENMPVKRVFMAALPTRVLRLALIAMLVLSPLVSNSAMAQ